MANGPSIYHYADYRRFLSDHYDHQKAHQYGFSVRVFARRAGIRSINYLRLVIDGKRNLTPQMAERFARGCELTGQEAAFFCALVDYCQAATTELRTRAYERLTSHRKFRAMRQLDAAQAEYHSTWYLPAVRELVRHPQFRADPKWVANKLVPRISTRQAKRALVVLLKLGLLKELADGSLAQAEPLITTGPGPLGHHIYNYHHMMLERAGAALDTLDRDERELSCITVAVSEDKLAEMKARIRAFRRQLLEEAELEQDPERVVQVNFQIFPLSAGTDGAQDSPPRSNRSGR